LREKPDFKHIKRWRKAIPQYELGYENTEIAIENFENKNSCVFFCSNFYKGISVGDSVKNAYQTAGKIEELFSHEQTRKDTKK
jgi:oxygen-dependent protoporphyrinogen oxidase